jgi:ATP-dependent Lon protease
MSQHNTIDNFNTTYLQAEYKRFALYLYNYQTHIDNCYNLTIIDSHNRNKYLKVIKEIIIELNITYKNCLLESRITLDPRVKCQLSYNSYINSCYLVNKDKIKPFVNINELMLCKLGSEIGFYNIKDAIQQILYNNCYYYSILHNQIYEKTPEIKLYSKIFVPLTYKCIYNTTTELHTCYFSKSLSQNALYELIDFNIFYLGIQLIFTGYIKSDALNVVLDTFLSRKKITIIEKMQHLNVDIDFGNEYINSSSIINLLCLTEDEYCDMLLSEYKKYLKVKKTKFIDLMQSFLGDAKLKDNSAVTIKNIMSTIKLLLLGPNDSVKIANLLYDILKESKKESSLDIDKLICGSIGYCSQIKLKKMISLNVDLNKVFTKEMVDYKKLILINDDIPDNVKSFALDKVKEMKSYSNDYYKQLLYVKTVINYPWSSDNSTFYENKDKKSTLMEIRKKMDAQVYGHIEGKNTIIENIGKWLVNPSAVGNAIGFVGSPGTGKTLLAKALGKALDVPFLQITLGGQNDGEYLQGHSYTYVSAQPGIIVKKMVEGGSSRCILYFDELDKTCIKNGSSEIQNILIHLIDPNTNKEFNDKFFQEFSFPLDKVLFMFSYNDSSAVNKILLDRITEINVEPYSNIDKINICQQFIIKEMESIVNIKKNTIIFNNFIIDHIINNYTSELGIRELKRKIEKIFLKINVEIIFGSQLENNLEITHNLIKKYLGEPTIKTVYHTYFM